MPLTTLRRQSFAVGNGVMVASGAAVSISYLRPGNVPGLAGEGGAVRPQAGVSSEFVGGVDGLGDRDLRRDWGGAHLADELLELRIRHELGELVGLLGE